MRYYTIEHLLRTFDDPLACKPPPVVINWESPPISAYKEVRGDGNLLEQEDGIFQQANTNYSHPVISVNG